MCLKIDIKKHESRTASQVRDILVRIRISESVTLTNGPDPTPDLDPDPAIFAGGLQDGNKKNFPSFFAHFFLMLYLHHFS
jgi:hypothetical protein